MPLPACGRSCSSSDFTTDGVLARVGSEAFAALGRDLTVPVRRAWRRPTPADRLVCPGTHAGPNPPPPTHPSPAPSTG